jgi:hypothetical protein
VNNIELCSEALQGPITPVGGTNVHYYTWRGGGAAGLSRYEGTDKNYVEGFTARNVASITDATVRLTPHYTGSDATCDGTEYTFGIRVHPLPVPTIAGLYAAAKGQSGVVYSTEQGMSDYRWVISGGQITSGGTPNSHEATVTWATDVNLGIISVTYNSTAGCSTDSVAKREVTLANQAVPNISGDKMVCPLNEYEYTTESGKYDYAWEITGGTPQTPLAGANVVKVRWDAAGAPSIKVSYRHQSAPGVPKVETTESDITKQKVATIISQPVGNTVCFGGDHTMSVEVDCEANPNYRWYCDGNHVGGDEPSYRAVAGGVFTVDVTSVCGSVTSDPATFVVKSTPTGTITGALTAFVTQEVTYVAGTPGTNYVWSAGSADIVSGGGSGDHAATLKWNSPGQKTITVSYTVDGCPTNTIYHTVDISQQSVPDIDFGNDLTANGLCLNTQGVYSTSSGKYSYKWTVDGGTISGRDNDSQVVVNWGAAGTGEIKVAYSEDPQMTPVESNPVRFTIHDRPQIDAIPIPSGVCDNSALNLTAPVVVSTKPLTSEGWKLNGLDFTSGNPVSYAQDGHPLVYEAVNACGTSQTPPETITVYDTPAVTITASTQKICPGTAIDLQTLVDNPNNYGLRFYRSLNGGTLLVNSEVSPYEQTTYYVEARNNGGCPGAARIPVTIGMKVETAITVQPVAPPQVGLNNYFDLSVTAVGENLQYRWYKNGTAIDASINPTAATATLRVGPTTIGDDGLYGVTVSGDCGTARASNNIVVNVLSGDATLKDLQVNGVTVPDFDPQATEYVYFADCDVELADIIGTPNHPSATVVNRNNCTLKPGDNVFVIEVTAENGYTKKSYHVNVIRDCYIPKITKDLEDAIICVGESYTFEIEAEGHNLIYEWYYGNNRIWGARGNTYTITNARLNDYERYYVIIKSEFEGYKASSYSKRVRLWVADYLPEILKFSKYPDPAINGSTHHIRVAGYPDVTEYVWSYKKIQDDTGSLSEEDCEVTFSPETGGAGENETWATFGNLSVGTGVLTVTMEHPCGTRELSRNIRVREFPLGMEEVTKASVRVYPNPTAGILNIVNTQENRTIRITDITGVLKGSYPSKEGTTTIDLAGYARGTYMLQYNGQTFKVIRR